MEHIPTPTTVTNTLAVLQTAGVVETIATGRPELACAATGNGDVPKIWLGIASNVIVCETATAWMLVATHTSSAAKPCQIAFWETNLVVTITF
jgi:Fe2+ or Zn2+ uptake regulation protein